jgi:hypothetical protein
MICIAALIVFSILALFSAKYRPLAKEAFQCVFLKLRLRPCQSGLDRRVRTAAMLPFAKRTPRLARFIYKAFPALSMLFVLLTVLSFGYMVWGGYNYALYGNCNGPGSTGFCVFDPSGPGASETGECTDIPHVPEALIKPTEENLTGLKVIHPQANFTVIFFGCYSCEYTRKAAPALIETIERNPDVRFVLVDFPIERHEGSTVAATAGNCVYDIAPEQYLSYAQQLYSTNLSISMPPFDNPQFATCMNTTHPRVTQGIALGKQTNVYGTPTYFIGDYAAVGPLNRRALQKLIDRER